MSKESGMRDEMSAKTRSDSFATKLSEKEKDTLYDWLQVESYADVKKKLALPRPEGFGIETHLTSLKRFFRTRTLELRREAAEELSRRTEGGEVRNFSEAAAETLEFVGYDLASGGGSAANFNDLSRWVGRTQGLDLKAGYLRVAQEHLALAKEQLALEKKKFEFNAARLALEHAAELTAIVKQPSLDDEEKIRRARERLFGPNLPE